MQIKPKMVETVTKFVNCVAFLIFSFIFEKFQSKKIKISSLALFAVALKPPLNALQNYNHFIVSKFHNFHFYKLYYAV